MQPRLDGRGETLGLGRGQEARGESRGEPAVFGGEVVMLLVGARGIEFVALLVFLEAATRFLLVVVQVVEEGVEELVVRDQKEFRDQLVNIDFLA